MRFILFLLIIISFTNARNYTYLLNDYNEEVELESKIVTNIAKEILKSDVKIYIPNATSEDENIYSKFTKVVNECNEANFIFVKYPYDINKCENDDAIFFTNNYKKLISNDLYIGAFFWSKSRPNIAFKKDRLNKCHIVLSKSYIQFIED